MKIFFKSLIIIVIIMSAGCTNNKIDNESFCLESKNKDFAIRLVGEKKIFDNYDSFELHGEIEYIGEEEQISFVHASPYYFMIVYDTNGNILYKVQPNDIGIKDIFYKNKVIKVSIKEQITFLQAGDYEVQFLAILGKKEGSYPETPSDIRIQTEKVKISILN